MFRYLPLLVPIALYLIIDIYAFQTFRTAIHSRYIHWLYWAVSFVVVSCFFYAMANDFRAWQNPYKAYISGFFIVTLIPKLILVFFAASDDLLRVGKLLMRVFEGGSSMPADVAGARHVPITRSEFLSRLGLLVAAVPFGSMLWGMVRNPYNYQVSRQILHIPDLPDDLVGLSIAQISDIHTGSFAAKRPILKAIDLLQSLKPDIVFFTGDLVNYRATEALPYVDIFSRITAPMGVFSIMGNHDYGDYFDWNSKEERQENDRVFMEIHKKMGWQLLRNEHKILEKNGRKIAVIGVENWSAKGFSQYGDLQKAYSGCQECQLKLLLSHDPSHWRAQVLNHYPDINATFSGHTHGMQFGVNFAGFKWSPVKYSYKEWIGLYQESK